MHIAGKKRAVADHYSQRAKKEGYPARSVYKLEEIEQKFSVLCPNAAILDVGAAPGSWSIYMSRYCKKRGKKARIVAVDLKEMTVPKKSGIQVLTGDAFGDEMLETIRGLGPFGTLVSDAAPATTGNRLVDTGRSFNLVASLIQLADEILEPGGNFVAKVFQGGDEQELLEMLRQRFEKARMFKPKACRKDSFETFLIGSGKQGELSQG